MAYNTQILNTANLKMILVMGVTGSGKSHFINTLVKGSTKEYRTLKSGTQHCQMVQTMIGDDTSVAIVDTPGFDDTYRSDAEIFTLITEYLTSQYQLGIPLSGIIYLHRITDQKMTGSALRNFKMFQKICGEKALGNVVLLTTMWDKLQDEMEGLDRDQELRSDFWSMMEEKGSYIARFDGSKEMAEAMIAILLAKEPIVLGIQKELQEGKRLEETSAGRILVPDIKRKIDNSKEHIESLEGRIREAERERDRLKKEKLERQQQEYREQQKKDEEQREKMRVQMAKETQAKLRKQKIRAGVKDGLQVFAAITSVTVSVVTGLLPLFGVNISF